MRRVGQVRRRDANEKPIVEALRRIGVLVHRVSDKGIADLICYDPRSRQCALVEVKMPGEGYTAAQQDLVESGWPFHLVRSVDEALALFLSDGRTPGRCSR